MKTLIVKLPEDNQAVMQVLNGLSKLGAIIITKSPYDEQFVEKIAQGEKDLKAGKGKKVDPSELWK